MKGQINDPTSSAGRSETKVSFRRDNKQEPCLTQAEMASPLPHLLFLLGTVQHYSSPKIYEGWEMKITELFATV